MATKPLTIPPFENTPLDEITAKVDLVKRTFRSNRTKDIEFRLVQLRKLYWGLVDYGDLIYDAFMKDMHKSRQEVYLGELGWAKTECLTQIKNLKKWAKDEPVVGVAPQYWLMKHRVRKEPRGVILQIGPYNYPYHVNVVGLIGAIAAGNCVVMKPSEQAPNTSMTLKKIMDDYLDPECYVCVNGGIAETQKLLESKYDQIFFTGGPRAGKIMAQKAAETLTPVVLELGGLNPAFVTKNADIKLAARRLLWGKMNNAGQVCLSQNYILVERSVLSQFIGETNNSCRTFFPQGAKASPDFGRIINKSHFQRIKKMLDSTNGKIVMGGGVDETELYIEPTMVLVDSLEDPMMTEESFGPIWAIMPFDNLDQAITIANEVDPTPLALVTFGSDAENERVIMNVTSGGATCNDSYSHTSITAAPLGGVGSSGTGRYRGYYSFKTFSHERVICKVPNWMDKLLRVRYPPYLPKELKRFQSMNEGKPDFDRNGNVARGLGYWLGLLLGLGGKSAPTAALRWGFLVALGAAFLELKRRNLGQ